MTFKQKYEESQGSKHVGRENGKGYSKCKGPEVGTRGTWTVVGDEVGGHRAR